jgi:hypothetical protein
MADRFKKSPGQKSPRYDKGHAAWGRIFWGFVALVLLSIVVTFLKKYFG